MALQRTELQNLVKLERAKCSLDYTYAIKKYFKIEHPLRGKINFELYDFQSKTLDELSRNRFNIILKSRQMGISTLVASYALMNMLMKDNYKVLVIATTQDVAKNLVHKVKVMYDNLPSWLKIPVVDNNKLVLSFKNGSFIKAVSSSPTAGRSEALSLLVIDEAAFVDNIDHIWPAAQMTLSTGGDAILLSTPNGVDNLFHQLWSDAEMQRAPEGLEPFYPIKLKWDLHPERDQKWRDQQTLLLGPRLAAQECDCDFLTSGHSVIDGELIKWYEDNMTREPRERRGLDGEYWIWEYPKFESTYIVCVDPARGDGSDDCAIQVFDLDTMEQVAEYIGRVTPRELGRMAVTIATEYNKAMLAIDNRNIGYDTVQEAIDLKYDNLYYSYRNDVYVDPVIHISKGYDLKSNKDKIPGFTTTTANRPMMVSKLERYFLEKTIKIYSKRLTSQLYVFVWLNGKAQARPGRRDDAVMATSMVVYLRETALKMKNIGIDITRKVLEHTQKRVYTQTRTNNDYWTMRDPRGNVISTKWLL